ncbi:MAG: SDR family NAD(P)-dependent oxidoreductase [Sulfobacillus sp.]
MIETPDLAPTAIYPDLRGKVVVITGGSRGVGASAALAFGANGAMVAVVGRDPRALDTTVAALRSEGGKAIGVVADCTLEDQLGVLRNQVSAELGPVDILVVFAGGNGMPVPTVTETSAHWREVVETDLTSTFLTTSMFLPEMLARHSGVIITMSSAAARQAAKSSAAYAAAKAGVIAFSRHLAGEYAHQGIRINCIAPSAIVTDRMRSWVSEEQRRVLGEAFPLGRLGQPKDISALTLFLASSASSWITGATIDVSGGKVML